MQFERLVIVPGHATLRAGISKADKIDPFDPNNWCLLPYQAPSEVGLYLEHIEAGLEQATNLQSILVFSGGYTRCASPWSEAESYQKAAEIIGRNMGINMGLFSRRIGLDEKAKDSTQNVLYAVEKFELMTGVSPRQVTAVGFDFKKDRFRVIAEILGIDRIFNYIGVNNLSGKSLAEASLAEKRTLDRLRASRIEGQPDKLVGRIWECPTDMTEMIRHRRGQSTTYAG